MTSDFPRQLAPFHGIGVGAIVMAVRLTGGIARCLPSAQRLEMSISARAVARDTDAAVQIVS